MGKKKVLFDNYRVIYPKINQSMKWKIDYIFFERKIEKNKILEEIFDNIAGQMRER